MCRLVAHPAATLAGMSLESLQALATAHEGVFTSAEAVASGLSNDEVLTLVGRGTVVRIHRGVYAFTVAGARPTFTQLARAACAATGGVASHWTAAKLHGLREAPERPIHVSISRQSRRRSPVGVTVHRTLLGRRTSPRPGDPPLTPPGRTLVDLAGIGVDERALHRFVNVLMSSRITTLDSLSASVGRCAGVPGVQHARAVLRDIGGPLDSVLEDQFLGLLRDWRLPSPMTQYPVAVGGRHYRLDFAWPDEQLIVEVDSYAHHSSREDFERDRLRENDLVSAGWVVLRVTSRQIEAGAVRLRGQLEDLLARRVERLAQAGRA